MLLVDTHRAGDGGVGPREHYSCAALGLLATVVVLLVAFGPIVAFVRLFGVLAATALVTLAFFWWAVWWETAEPAWVRLGNTQP